MANMDIDAGTSDVGQDLVCAFRFDGNGGAIALDWDGVRQPDPHQGAFEWVHIQHPGEGAHPFLTPEHGIDELVADALLAQETRPRFSIHGEGVLLNLRGVNLNPGADPEDMVSIRMFITPSRVISVRLRRLMAVEDVRAAIARNQAPKTVGEFVSELAQRLTERMDPVIIQMNEQIDDLEESLLSEPTREMRADLAKMRMTAIRLRRYIAAQREALNHLVVDRVPWLEERDRAMTREAADRVTRFVEDLDAARERTSILHEQIADARAEQMNQNMFVLSIIAAIFLPLGLLTGLFGINVGGMPGVDSPWAFGLITVFLVVVGIAEWWLFKRLGWVR